MNLSRHGYRVIGVEWPPYWNLGDWCVGFRALLTHLALEKVHLFGAALGGFLAQKFAEFTRPCPRVASLILCNTFTDSEVQKKQIISLKVHSASSIRVTPIWLNYKL